MASIGAKNPTQNQAEDIAQSIARNNKRGDVTEQLRSLGLDPNRQTIKDFTKEKDPDQVRKKLAKLSTPGFNEQAATEEATDSVAKKSSITPLSNGDPLSLVKHATMPELSHKEFEQNLKNYYSAVTSVKSPLEIVEDGTFAHVRLAKPTQIIVPISSEYGYGVPLNDRVKIERMPGPALVWKVKIAEHVNDVDDSKANILYVPAALASNVTISTAIKTNPDSNAPPEIVSRSLSEIESIDGNPQDVKLMQAAEKRAVNIGRSLVDRIKSPQGLADFYRTSIDELEGRYRSYLAGVNPEHQIIGGGDDTFTNFSQTPVFDSSSLHPEKPIVFHFGRFDKKLIEEEKMKIMEGGAYSKAIKAKLDEFAAGKHGAILHLKANEYISELEAYETNYKSKEDLSIEFSDAKTGKVIQTNTFKNGFVFSKMTRDELDAALKGKVKGIKAKIIKGDLKKLEALKMVAVYEQPIAELDAKGLADNRNHSHDVLKGTFLMSKDDELVITEDLNSGLTSDTNESGINSYGPAASDRVIEAELALDAKREIKGLTSEQFLGDINSISERTGDVTAKGIITEKSAADAEISLAA